jgi:hypothetical protein
LNQNTNLQMKHAKHFKIRSSRTNEIMGQRGLGTTGISYCKEWLKQKDYQQRVGFKGNKYTSKGHKVEDQGIQDVATFLGVDLVFKNEDYFYDDYKQGTPDVLPAELSNEVWDHKASYSLDTFPAYEDKESNVYKKYYGQGQSYLGLTDREVFRLCYTLQDTPIETASKDAYYYCQNNDIEFTEEFENEWIEKTRYSTLYPLEKRVKIFVFKRDDAYIQKIHDRVIECREVISKLESVPNIIKL